MHIRHPEQPDVTDIRLCDGVFVKRMVFRRVGMVIPQHGHAYPHLSVCAAGAAAWTASDGRRGIVRCSEVIEIPASVMHTFTTLEPNTVIMCIHNTDRDGVISHENGLNFEGAV